MQNDGITEFEFSQIYLWLKYCKYIDILTADCISLFMNNEILIL